VETTNREKNFNCLDDKQLHRVCRLGQSSASDDLKQSGQEVKKAGKDTGKAAKDAGKGVKKGTKKGVHKTAKATEKAPKRWKTRPSSRRGGCRRGALQLKSPAHAEGTPDILAQIVEQKKLELAFRDSGIEARAEQSIPERRDFLAALAGRTPAVIAEVKRASPSRAYWRPISIRLRLRDCMKRAARRHCRC